MNSNPIGPLVKNQLIANLLNIPDIKKVENPRDILLVIANQLDEMYAEEQITTHLKKDDGILGPPIGDTNSIALSKAKALLLEMAAARLLLFDTISEFISLTSSVDSLEGFGIDGCEAVSLSCLLYTSPSPRDS